MDRLPPAQFFRAELPAKPLGSGTISSIFPTSFASFSPLPTLTQSALVCLMHFFSSPTSFRNNVLLSVTSLSVPRYQMAYALSNDTIAPFDLSIMSSPKEAPHANHPALGNLLLLVFEAVMEVVCVSLPGYIIARQGMFDADMQKFVANLNVSLFTPCLSKGFPFLDGPKGLMIRGSFYQTCKSAYFREDRRVGCNTSDICCYDIGFVLLRSDCL